MVLRLVTSLESQQHLEECASVSYRGWDTGADVLWLGVTAEAVSVSDPVRVNSSYGFILESFYLCLSGCSHLFQDNLPLQIIERMWVPHSSFFKASSYATFPVRKSLAVFIERRCSTRVSLIKEDSVQWVAYDFFS